jgi:hypothetical protein
VIGALVADESNAGNLAAGIDLDPNGLHLAPNAILDPDCERVATHGLVCCFAFERSELRKHSDVGLEPACNVVSGLSPKLILVSHRLGAGVESPRLYRRGDGLQMNVARRQPGAHRLNLNVAMGGGLHNRDQGFAGQIALQPAKILGSNHNHFVAPMHRDVLRALAACPAHELTETRLSILQDPSPGSPVAFPASRCRSLGYFGFRYSSHTY